MNLNKIKTTAIAGMLAASMLLPNMTVLAYDSNINHTTSPSIEKTVDVADGVTSIYEATDKNLTFLVKQVANTSGNKAPNDGSYFSDATVSIDVSDLSNLENNAKMFTEKILGSSSDTASTIKDLKTGEYTFQITETTTQSTTDFGWTTINKNNNSYYLRVVVKSNGDVLYFITTATEGADKTAYSDESKKFDSADFENVYNKKSVDDKGNANTLTVKKTIDADDAAYINANETFPITVTFTVPSTQTTVTENSYKVTTPATGYNRSVSNDGKTVTITASLKKDETIVVTNIAVGATYTVSEDQTKLDGNFVDELYTLQDGSTTEYTESKFFTADGKENGGVVTFKENSQQVTVRNDYNNITITGVVTDIAPYVTLVVVAVAAIAAYVVMKRRVAR